MKVEKQKQIGVKTRYFQVRTYVHSYVACVSMVGLKAQFPRSIGKMTKEHLIHIAKEVQEQVVMEGMKLGQRISE